MHRVEFWSLTRVVEVTGISKSEVYRRVKLGQFPRSHKYRDGERRRFWISTEIMAWQQEQIDFYLPGLHPSSGSPSEFDDLL